MISLGTCFAVVVVLLVLHLVLLGASPLVTYAETGTGSTTSSLKQLGYAFATILVFIGGIAYVLGGSDIAIAIGSLGQALFLARDAAQHGCALGCAVNR